MIPPQCFSRFFFSTETIVCYALHRRVALLFPLLLLLLIITVNL